ncbi:MAG TPA: hypothetical protein VKU02_19130 [Gemmataceae bacterium]|nr:hypothetical protein [Gemmataceae bacterium]
MKQPRHRQKLLSRRLTRPQHAKLFAARFWHQAKSQHGRIASLLGYYLEHHARTGQLGRVCVEMLFWLDAATALARRPGFRLKGAALFEDELEAGEVE